MVIYCVATHQWLGVTLPAEENSGLMVRLMIRMAQWFVRGTVLQGYIVRLARPLSLLIYKSTDSNSRKRLQGKVRDRMWWKRHFQWFLQERR